MKNVTIIIIFIFPFLSFSQEKNKVENVKTENDSVTTVENIAQREKNSLNLIPQDSMRQHSDSLSINSDDTTIVVLQENQDIIIPIEDARKIILIKEKTPTDILNYIFPIFTLFLGAFVTWLFNFLERKRQIKKSGNRWIAELRGIEEPLKQQIKSLEEFNTKFDDNVFSMPEPQIYQSLSGDIFKCLDKNELYEFIKYNYSKKNINTVIKVSNRTNGFISILSYLQIDLFSKYNKYLSNTSEKINALSKNMQDFNNAFRNYTLDIERDLGGNFINDPTYKPIANLYETYITPHLEDGEYNPYILDNELFIPLTNLFVTFRSDDRMRLYLEKPTIDAINTIKHMRFEKRYIIESVANFIERYTDELTTLSKIIDEIQNSKK